MEASTQAGIAEQTAAERIVAFDYPACAGASAAQFWDGWAGAGNSDRPAGEAESAPSEAALRAEFEQKLAESARRSFEAGRERGRQEERHETREAQAAAEQSRKRQTAELAQSFSQERDRYLQAVEHEVVDLALAVAARILRREAQMDPLLLTGAVRVALGQLTAASQIRLLVPGAELEQWTEAISLLPNPDVKPAVIAGEGMRLGDCRVETELGTVDIGIRAQLGEIERGFFDRARGLAQVWPEPANAALKSATAGRTA